MYINVTDQTHIVFL